jgi:hypothetical protein
MGGTGDEKDERNDEMRCSFSHVETILSSGARKREHQDTEVPKLE